MYKPIFYISLITFSSFALSEELCYNDYNIDTEKHVNVCLNTVTSMNCIERNNCALVIQYEITKISHPTTILMECDVDISYVTKWPSGYERTITPNHIISKKFNVNKKAKGGIIGLKFNHLNMSSDYFSLKKYSCNLYKPL